MRADIEREGWKMTFTLEEINQECDRREHINTLWKKIGLTKPGE